MRAIEYGLWQDACVSAEEVLLCSVSTLRCSATLQGIPSQSSALDPAENGPIHDLQKAELQIAIPPKHLEIIAEEGLSDGDILKIQDLFLKPFETGETSVDRERADLAAIKLRAAAYAASGAETVTINDHCGTAFKGGVWETVVKLPSGKSSYWDLMSLFLAF